jgi:hypothetical protein
MCLPAGIFSAFVHLFPVRNQCTCDKLALVFKRTTSGARRNDGLRGLGFLSLSSAWSAGSASHVMNMKPTASHPRPATPVSNLLPRKLGPLFISYPSDEWTVVTSTLLTLFARVHPLRSERAVNIRDTQRQECAAPRKLARQPRCEPKRTKTAQMPDWKLAIRKRLECNANKLFAMFVSPLPK